MGTDNSCVTFCLALGTALQGITTRADSHRNSDADPGRRAMERRGRHEHEHQYEHHAHVGKAAGRTVTMSPDLTPGQERLNYGVRRAAIAAIFFRVAASSAPVNYVYFPVTVKKYQNGSALDTQGAHQFFISSDCGKRFRLGGFCRGQCRGPRRWAAPPSGLRSSPMP